MATVPVLRPRVSIPSATGSASARRIVPTTRTEVDQRSPVLPEIGDQVMAMVPLGSDAFRAADPLGLGPAADASKLHQATFSAAIPKPQLGTFDVAIGDFADPGVDRSLAEADCHVGVWSNMTEAVKPSIAARCVTSRKG